MKENNELIAEFMGIKLHDGMAVFDPTFNEPPEELQYHTSWDWLMPVVEKIGKTMQKMETKPFYELDEARDILMSLGDSLCEVDIIHANQKVVEFIKWYNTTKQQEQKQPTEPQNESRG